MTDTQPNDSDESYEIPREAPIPPTPARCDSSASRMISGEVRARDSGADIPLRKAKAPIFKVGDAVKAHDRDNYGHVSAVDGDEVVVHFVSETGHTADVPFSTEMLTHLGGQDAPDKEFQILTLAELLQRPPPKWLVDGVLRVGELSMIYGQSNSGKTFVALDLALHVVTGKAWCGHAVMQGRVLYIAAEGGSSIGTRVCAWDFDGTLNPNADPWTNFHVLDEAVQFFAGELAGLLDAIAALPEPPVMIIVDTLARCSAGGDENSAKDMGRLVQIYDQLRKVTSAAVVLVHHAGKPKDNKNGNSERGSSALRGAADTMIEVTKEENDHITLIKVHCDKQKEAIAFDDLTFELSTVTVGLGGESPTTSCKLVWKFDERKQAIRRHPDLDNESLKICRTLRDDFFEDGAPHGRLQKNSGLSSTTFDRRSKVLVEKGYIDRRGKNKSTRYFLTSKFVDPAAPSQSSPPITPTSTPGGEGSSITSSSPPLGGKKRVRARATERRSPTEASDDRPMD